MGTIQVLTSSFLTVSLDSVFSVLSLSSAKAAPGSASIPPRAIAANGRFIERSPYLFRFLQKAICQAVFFRAFSRALTIPAKYGPGTLISRDSDYIPRKVNGKVRKSAHKRRKRWIGTERGVGAGLGHDPAVPGDF